MMYNYMKSSDVFGPATTLKTGTSLTNGIYFQIGNFSNSSGHVDVMLNGKYGSNFYKSDYMTTYYWVGGDP